MNISSIGNAGVPVSTTVQPALPRPPDASQRDLIQAVKAVNASDTLDPASELTFILDRTTGRMIIRIVNSQTGELIREIPAQSVFRMAEQLTEG